MNRSSLILLAFALCACAQSNKPSSGSQTHFLERCDTSCPAPYACLNHVCTLECERDSDTCAEQIAGARCVPWTERMGEGMPIDTCDLECMSDGDCSALSDAHACEESFCRAPGDDDGTSGQGGTSGSSGTGGSSGMGGSGGSDSDASVVDANVIDASASAGEICDGSDSVRFAITSKGGFLHDTYEFTNPYGHWFLLIDGKCNYFLSTHQMRGIRGGVLSFGWPEAIAADLGWDSIERWSEDPTDPGCPDGSTTTLYRPGASTSCTCSCSPDFHPQDKIDAFAKISQWLDTLGVSAEWLTHDVQAIAVQWDNAGMRSTVDWPLDRAMTELDFIATSHEDFASTTPATFSSADARALRALRAAALELDETNAFIPVLEGTTNYELYLREELPPEVELELNALIAP